MAELYKKKLGEMLIDGGYISNEQLNKTLIMQKKSDKKLGELLIEEGFVTEDDIINVLKDQLGLSYVDLDKEEIETDAVNLLSESIARRHCLIPIKIDGENIIVAMEDPLNIFAVDDVTIYTGKIVKPVISKGFLIKKYIDKYYSRQKAIKAAEDYIKEYSKENKIEKSSLEADASGSAPIVKLVDSIFDQAITNRASDIHIEPFEKEIRIKFRIDGILYEIMKVDVDLLSALIARIKVIGGMDIAEKRIPQDGRASYFYNANEYDMRVSTLPTIFGEKIVIRIQDKTDYIKGKSELGFSKYDLEKYDKIISSPNGIILVSGPTGSGKTTTLYTMLSELNTGEKNIITVEDPVESTLYGVNQVEVNVKAGLTFGTALRSILRQDPDIIMIGEIRDSETAEIAVRSAITGHLVLSTIHTNDAPSSIIRLNDMGIENFLISSSLIGVISQRLVRKICPYCKEEYEADKSEITALGLEEDKSYKLYKGKGCNYCSEKGYLGRTGIYEILIVNKELKNLILTRTSSDNIRDMAVKNGMITLKDSCRRKVLKGETTVEEFLRVTYSID